MEKTLMQKLTLFSMNFDFSTGQQKEILNDLQRNNYKLVGYKGATGNNQITVGVPTWFIIPYGTLFGEVEIDYEPKYKVYVFNKSNIDINTRITMQALSDEIPLGTKVEFNQDGSFRTSPGGSEGVIIVQNNRPAGTSPLTVGLAAKVDLQYLPFCAFTCAPQQTVSMKPSERVALVASQTNATPGSMANQINNPGCSFMFSAENTIFDLQMIPATYGIENIPGKAPVETISPGSSLVKILNTF
ncbi:hypothetical protein [Chryseobacterium sp. MYb328]|uniref:hypothetical protein n=1 Tax=Chryseobacterium sp. MYb328 TaxID=2745231 RepID=UPI00309729EA